MFEKCASDTADNYCKFLLKVTSDQARGEQKELYENLTAVYVNLNFLVSGPDAAPVSYLSILLWSPKGSRQK